MEALRLVSESCNDRVGSLLTSNSVTRDGKPTLPEWLEGFSLPSREALLTLLWTLKVEERKSKSEASNTNSDIRDSANMHMYRNKLDATSRKRQVGIDPYKLGEKRQRLD